MKLMIRAHDLGVMGEGNIVDKLNELGLDGIQLVAYKSIEGVSYTEGGLTLTRAREIGDRLKKAGKAVALVGAYFNPVHPNIEKAERGERIFAEYLALSNALGAGVVGSETGSYMGDPWGFHPENRTEKAMERVVSTFKRLADVAGQHGACVAIEGAYNHVCYTPDALFEAVKAIDRKNVRVIFDLYNYLSASNYNEAYEILARGHELFGSDILLYHLKDFRLEEGRPVQCAVGRGVLNFNRILREIYAVNPCATLVLEGTVGEDIRFSVAHVRGIIEEIEKETNAK